MDDAIPDPKKVTLTDGKITLRPLRQDDSPASYEAIRESLPEMGVWLPFAHENYAPEENRAWMKMRRKEWQKGIAYQFRIADTTSGKFLGGCGLNEIDGINRRANLGYWVRTSETGRGIAPAAVLLLARWGFDIVKLTRIEILIAVDNQRSLRVAAKAGAKREGVLRQRIIIRDKTYDAVMHSLVPGDI